MKSLNIVMGLCLLFSLVSCNEAASNRKPGRPDVSIPTLETDDSIRSSIHRRRGSAVLSYADEITNTLSGELPTGVYVAVPDMELDDEGTPNGNIQTVSNLGRPTKVCGIDPGFPSITERVKDCETINGSSAKWNGTSYGASGEGTWQLVSFTDDAKEIWLDGRTGMVWSEPRVSGTKTQFNWCKASGNTQGTTASTSVNCQELAENTSICHGYQTPGIGSQIIWRLPTRNDLLQADLNGLRFVMNITPTEELWTATMVAGSSGRATAWTYNTKNGSLSYATLDSLKRVRCIGVPAMQ